MTLQEWVARSYRSYFIISSFMLFMFFFPKLVFRSTSTLKTLKRGEKMFIFNPVEEAESQSHSAYVWGKRYVQSGAVYDVFFLNSCVNGTEVIHVQFSQAEFRSSDYSENCNLKSALTTGGPSSSCEVIILRNNCHGEIIRVYIRNHFSNPFRGFPRT